MKLGLASESNTQRRFALIAPAGVAPRETFDHVIGDSDWRQHMLSEMQRLRGRIYWADGAIKATDLTRDGRHVQAIDEASWHLLILGENDRVLGCTRYFQHKFAPNFRELRVRSAALATDNRWSGHLRLAVERELDRARHNGFSYVEVGGWALDESVRSSTDALRSVLFTYAWSRAIGGCLGLCTATHRNGSASILRRIGGQPLEWDGFELPPYYDPNYNCEMEVLRFDSRLPNQKYLSVIDEMRSQISMVPVICGTKPAEKRHSFVPSWTPVPARGAAWIPDAVQSAA
jgi:hypothetical protein